MSKLKRPSTSFPFGDPCMRDCCRLQANQRSVFLKFETCRTAGECGNQLGNNCEVTVLSWKRGHHHSHTLSCFRLHNRFSHNDYGRLEWLLFNLRRKVFSRRRPFSTSMIWSRSRSRFFSFSARQLCVYSACLFCSARHDSGPDFIFHFSPPCLCSPLSTVLFFSLVLFRSAERQPTHYLLPILHIFPFQYVSIRPSCATQIHGKHTHAAWKSEPPPAEFLLNPVPWFETRSKPMSKIMIIFLDFGTEPPPNSSGTGTPMGSYGVAYVLKS